MTGEKYSSSVLCSQILGSEQLFFHEDILEPGRRSSGSHRHSLVEEVVFVLSGSVVLNAGGVETELNAGDYVLLQPKDSQEHFIINKGAAPAKTMTFAFSTPFDQVLSGSRSSLEIHQPEIRFDESLRDNPVDWNQWNEFLADLEVKLGSESVLENRLKLHEHIGMAQRILGNLDSAEEHLLKAVSLSISYPRWTRSFQNLIRLAHVYQWKKEFAKSHLLFDQAQGLLQSHSASGILKAAYHQHLGKLYFDQGRYKMAEVEFALALRIRQEENAPQDQILSSEISLKETKNKLKMNGQK